MDALLLLLTAVAFSAAVGFAVIAWRLVREDRRRSAARVAALSSVLDDEASVPDASARTGGETHPPDPRRVPVAAMFETAPGASLKGRPLLKAAVVGVMAVVVVVAAAMSNGRQASTPAAAAAHGTAPLELLSMRHVREGTTLTVTGLVRNPPAGAEARRVTAVVFAFDNAGGFVASGRAPLEFAVLGPNDESPFVVAIPNVTNVARYRVSFRTDDGVVRHVDRRADHMQLAGNQ